MAWTPLEISIEPEKEEEVVVALMEKMLEILATTPDELAISKYASGVESPSPNLPNEVEEKTPRKVPELSLISRSAWKEAPWVNSQKPVIRSPILLEAGPLIQSRRTKALDEVPSWETLKEPPSKEMEP